MKWLAVLAFALAIVIRFAWHSSFAISFPSSPSMRRAMSVSNVAFWSLLIVGTVLLFVAWTRRAH